MSQFLLIHKQEIKQLVLGRTCMLMMLMVSVSSNCSANATPSTTPVAAPPSIDNTFVKSKTNSEFGANRDAFL